MESSSSEFISKKGPKGQFEYGANQQYDKIQLDT